MMKPFVFSFLMYSALFFGGAACTSHSATPVSKVVVGKVSPVATYVQGYSNTEYYLIAEDGTSIEVDMVYYAQVQVGQTVSSYRWAQH